MSRYHEVAEDEAEDQNDERITNHIDTHFFPFFLGELTYLRRFQNNQDHSRGEEDEIRVDDKQIRRAADIAAEIEAAQELQKQMEKEARKQMREAKKADRKQKLEEKRAEISANFDNFKAKFQKA